MSDLLVELIPEMLGLVITPAAVVGSVLLLQSNNGLRKALCFAGGFLLQYAIIAITALIGGAADSKSQNDDLKSIVSVVAGGLFLLLAAFQLTKRPAPDAPPPRWITQLDKAGTTAAFVIGLVMSIVNPNLLILLSGLSIVSASGGSTLHGLIGVLALLVASMVDFLVPIGLYVLLGDRARAGLASTKTWMLDHNRALGLAVLFAFGTLFVVRGVSALG